MVSIQEKSVYFCVVGHERGPCDSAKKKKKNLINHFRLIAESTLVGA